MEIFDIIFQINICRPSSAILILSVYAQLGLRYSELEDDGTRSQDTLRRKEYGKPVTQRQEMVSGILALTISFAMTVL